MSENRSIYASPITWAIILILIIVLGITISSLFTFSDDLSSVQQVQEQSGTQQVSERRTVVALSNAQIELEDDLEASDAAQQSAIEAVYSTQESLSDAAATQVEELQQLIEAISTDQAAVNETLTNDSLGNQAAVSGVQATQLALSESALTREALLPETIAAINADQTAVNELQETQAAFLNNVSTREAVLQATISVMQSTQAELVIPDPLTVTPTRTPTFTQTVTSTLAAPTNTTTPTTIPPTPSALLYIEDVTALRAGPGTEFERLAWLRQSETGYPILLVDNDAQYYQISVDSQVGWVAVGARIRVEGDVSQLPTAEPGAARTPTPTPTPGN